MAREKNVFWIGGNVLFDLNTGATSEVLLFVYREEDASTFTIMSAKAYLQFVSQRTPKTARINWSIEAASKRRDFFVIRGEQEPEPPSGGQSG